MNGGSIARVLAFCQGLRREYSRTVATHRPGSSLSRGTKFMGRLKFSVGSRSKARLRMGWVWDGCQVAAGRGVSTKAPRGSVHAPLSRLSCLSRLEYGQMAISLAAGA